MYVMYINKRAGHVSDSELMFKKVKGTFFLSRYPILGTIQSALHFNPMTDLHIPKPIRLLRETYNHAAITARRQFIHISTTVYSQILTYTAE